MTILIKRSKVRKVNHAFLAEDIQIEDLNPGLLPRLVSQLALLAELIVFSWSACHHNTSPLFPNSSN